MSEQSYGIILKLNKIIFMFNAVDRANISGFELLWYHKNLELKNLAFESEVCFRKWDCSCIDLG